MTRGRSDSHFQTHNSNMSAISFAPVTVRATVAPKGVTRRTAARASTFSGNVKAFHPLGYALRPAPNRAVTTKSQKESKRTPPLPPGSLFLSPKLQAKPVLYGGGIVQRSHDRVGKLAR
jgi:hypothetical protein